MNYYLRVQRFHIRLLRLLYDIVNLPGKIQLTVDALSRAPIESVSQ